MLAVFRVSTLCYVPDIDMAPLSGDLRDTLRVTIKAQEEKKDQLTRARTLNKKTIYDYEGSNAEQSK
jgi:hypothetical protein